MIRMMRRPAAAVLALLAASLADAAEHNTLTAEERRAGFQLLFDGRSLDGWELARALPLGKWVAEDGCLVPKGRPGELRTTAQYGDFELLFDWKIARGGNSGVMYRVEKPYHPPTSGPEYQLLDDQVHGDGRYDDRKTASAYAIFAPKGAAPKPPGEWNTGRIVASGPRIEHWLNGVKVLGYEIGSPEWTARVAAGKFARHKQYGRASRGHIVLQDHGSPAWFRNLKLRVLD
jgi:hypothetical protein